MEMRIDKRGRVVIPKKLREQYNLTPGIMLSLGCYDDYDGVVTIKLKPVHVCSACGKALPDELEKRGACLSCTPIPRISVQVY